MMQDSTGPTLLSIKRKELLSLDTQKKSLESEAEAIVSELTTVPESGGRPIGIDTPLIDSDGYPRADIDIYRARTLRKRFHEIQTDHKELSKKVDRGLLEISALTKSEQSIDDETQSRLAPKPKPKFDPLTGKWVVRNWDGSVAGVENGEQRSFENLTAPVASTDSIGGVRSSTAAIGQNAFGTIGEQGHSQQLPEEEPTTPFAIIDLVSPNSPAHEAGIMVGDLLLRFGSVNSENHRDFRAIAELVPEAAGEGRSISIAVRRKEGGQQGTDNFGAMKTKTLNLRPKPWAGRGMLGCHIQKYDGSN